MDSELVDDTTLLILVQNSYTTGLGKTSRRNIKLFMVKDSTDRFTTIKNSIGLSNFAKNDIHTFAIKTGFVIPVDTMDSQIIKKHKDAIEYAKDLSIKLYSDLKSKLKVNHWTWEIGHGNYAHGKGIVTNNSGFNVPKPKYVITYFDKQANEITKDEGYITYDVLHNGESKSFSFYTDYVGKAKKASVNIEFETQKILDFVLNDEYSGSEFIDFYTENINKSSSNTL